MRAATASSQGQGHGLKVTVAPEFGKWTEDGGIRVMEDMLAKHKDINAVFCEGDVMCLGAQKAIADAKRTQEIQIFGFDGQKAAIEQIMKGSNFVATGVNPPRDREGRVQDHVDLSPARARAA